MVQRQRLAALTQSVPWPPAGHTVRGRMAVSVSVESDYPAETFVVKLDRLLFGYRKKKKKGPLQKTEYQFGCCFIVLLVIFTLSTIGCLLMWFTDLYLDSILNQMTLKEDSEIYRAWQSPPVQPLICVHVFNYTNMERYAAGVDARIRVQEVGPYCYRETLLKTNVQFYDNGTVSYGDRRTHVFEEKNSTGSRDDIIVVPNLPLISMIALTHHYHQLVQKVVFEPVLRLSNNGSATVRVTAHDFLFGYDDTFISLVKGATIFAVGDFPFQKFGILAMRAAETKERLTICTGAGNLSEIGVVTALNGQPALSAWDDAECNRLDGSDGAFFPRHQVTRGAKLHLFHKDLCRKLPLVYQRDVNFQDGVMGMRFHTPPDVYNTTGTCYCKPPARPCPPVGVFDISPCSMNVPIMMSFPHFMNAEPSVTEHLEGLHPDPERHDFFIDIQPILGFTLGTVSRIQLNVRVKKSINNNLLTEFPEGIILPVVWFEVTADRLPPDLFKMIYHASVTVQWIQWSLQWGLLSLSALSVVGMAFSCRRRTSRPPLPVMKPCLTVEVVESRLTSL